MITQAGAFLFFYSNTNHSNLLALHTCFASFPLSLLSQFPGCTWNGVVLDGYAHDPTFSCTPRRQCCYFSVAGIGHRFRCILCKHTCDSRATKILISFLQMQGSTHASRETNLWIASPQPESLVQENFDGIEPSSPAPNSILCAHGVNVLASNRCGEIKR